MNAGREEAARSNCFHDNRYRLWKRKPGKKKKKTSNPMLQFFFLFLSLALFSLKTSEKFPTRGQPLPPSLALFFFSQILALCFQLSRVPTLSLKLPLTSLLVPLFELSRFLFFSNKNQSPFFCSAQLPFQTSFPSPDITFWNPKRKLPPFLSALVPL